MNSLLSVRDLTVEFVQHKKSQTLVDKVSFEVYQGQCLGILGESGSGKSMTCKAIMGLLDKSFHISGEAVFQEKDLLKVRSETLRGIRGRDICMILQNPMTCFDPLYRIGYQMKETFVQHEKLNKSELHEKMIDTLVRMQIKQPEDVLKKFPHQLSGGMLQRVMIGLALASEPKLIIADEPTTAIDSITQYEIIKEFIKIKDKKNIGLIFISHDLGVISKLADEVVVMHRGEAVQQGNIKEVLTKPGDSYTKTLIEKKYAVMRQFEEIIHSTKGESI